MATDPTPAPSALDALARAARDAADREDPILALLREVEASNDAPTYIARDGESLADFARRVRVAQADRDGHAPRLAAIVRVLRDVALRAHAGLQKRSACPFCGCSGGCGDEKCPRAVLPIALARAEAIAKGE